MKKIRTKLIVAILSVSIIIIIGLMVSTITMTNSNTDENVKDQINLLVDNAGMGIMAYVHEVEVVSRQLSRSVLNQLTVEQSLEEAMSQNTAYYQQTLDGYIQDVDGAVNATIIAYDESGEPSTLGSLRSRFIN